MSEKRSIVELVGLLLRGIETATPINPIKAGDHFETAIEELELCYVHCDGSGYVMDGDNEVMLVHFTHDGVEFDEHHEHPLTLRVIQTALHTLTHCEQLLLMCVDDDDSDDDDFEWV
jgi:hypothetical protein